MPRQLVLASTSEYRKELLSRLGLPFETIAPQADESRMALESPRNQALRLSELKARAVAHLFPDALIIGSDQVAHIGDTVFGKPGSHENAVLQLQQLSGQTVNFVSGVCVYDSATNRAETTESTTRVRFRKLSENTIENYLRREQPYNCAGSAKSEGLGIALIDSMHCDDPTALIGLPLIALCDLLGRHGVDPLA